MATTPTKSKLSPAQMAARKANAARATGPITEEGKRRAAKNALLHGLCSLAPVLAGEDPAEFERMLAQWLKEMEPGNADERRMVYDMVCATIAADRVRKADAAALAIRMQKAGEGWDGERAKTLGETTYLVGRGRHDLVTPLLARGDGVRWLIAQWERLDGRLADGKPIDATERTLMLTMLGCVYADLDDPQAREVHALGMALELAAGLKPEEHAKYQKKGIAPDSQRPRERLRAMIAPELEALRSLLPDLEAAEAAERQTAVDAAAVDTSDEGARRHRYLNDHLRTVRQLSASLIASKTARLMLYGRILSSSHGEPAWTPPAESPKPAEEPVRNEPKTEATPEPHATYDRFSPTPTGRPAFSTVLGRPSTILPTPPRRS